ncbi:multiheme c-type cytochrome [Bradymonas sediminis]|uniref:Uncharacterized protein n=1 Tax=Bradymonas sediminis TaxID=1548548 RepID=A0A2Z4FPG9_9DELT|nr:multiheme c-type cytochrome [Bradymonas sediminis]AWV90568.1 hypothetical protein DN745_15025 [Bradymonas sediminis]TDP72035.1 cytochrome c554/c'-like protein [Bradymonas sediminis]
MKNTKRWTILILILGAWALVLAQSCDRTAKRADGSSSAVEKDGEQAKEDGDAAAAEGDLPGEAAPGTIAVESPGPSAPAVFFLAGLKGYLEPCGCSAEILLGGIERLTGYVDAAQKLHPASTMLDGGDMLFEFAEIEEHDIPQVKAKAEVIVAAQKRFGTQVTVPGELDFALGSAFYLEKLEAAGVEPIAANLTIAGKKLEAGRIIEVGDIKLGVVGAVEPRHYEGLEDVATTEPVEAVKKAVAALKKDGATTTLLIMHGDLAATRAVLNAVDGIDFGVVGHAPRESDEVQQAGGGFTLEAFDQGRYLGVLKLYERDAQGAYSNAGAASVSEIEKLERVIEHKQGQVDRFPPSKRHENPPILARLQDDIKDLKEQVVALKSASLNVPESGNAFIYRPIAMVPGLPINEAMESERRVFNESLKSLQMAVKREVVPPKEGEAFYVGTNNCATCHVGAKKFWDGTAHAKAVKTLEDRDKLFDQSCIGCHVVGYEKPGGSVIGKLHYEAKLGERTIQKDLENVGCENCHGPGSAHMAMPVDAAGKPQFINPTPTVTQCMECHVPEHSPKFNFDAYVKDITGAGHEFKSK